jgi:hypothetical protein
MGEQVLEAGVYARLYLLTVALHLWRCMVFSGNRRKDMTRLTVGLLLKELNAARKRGQPHENLRTLANSIGLKYQPLAHFVGNNELYEQLGISKVNFTEEYQLERLRLMAQRAADLNGAMHPMIWLEGRLRRRGETAGEVSAQIKTQQALNVRFYARSRAYVPSSIQFPPDHHLNNLVSTQTAP